MPTLSRLLCLSFAAIVASAPAAALEPMRVAPGVYAVIGTGGTPSAENRGRVANAGFMVGPTGVVVVDSGVSERFGRELLAAIRRVTDRPVQLVILTHATQEFVFGAQVFADAGAEIAAHQDTVTLMAGRCQHCLETLRALIGPEMEGTRLAVPGRAFAGTVQLDAGGMTIDVLHLGWASTPGDVVVYHPASGVAFTGGLAVAHEVPPIRDCDFDNWQAALGRLRMLPIRSVVPGFGAVGGPETIDATLGYLQALDTKVRALYADSSSLLQALDRSDLAAYQAWGGYEPRHRQNVLHRYLQLEIEELGGDSRSTAQPESKD